jgi:acyl carrier protein
MTSVVHDILQQILQRKGISNYTVTLDSSLRHDLEFDSFDLAELTVKIEDRFNIDIFEENINIDKVYQIFNLLGLGA